MQRQHAPMEKTLLVDSPSRHGTHSISCTLSHVSLEDQPHYTALSYVWGDLNDTMPIFLDGEEILITRNLHEALYHFSLSSDTSTTVLWVDALCIDQSNDSEKSHQVQQMGSIYKTSAIVIVWLGCVENEFDRILDKLCEFGDLAIVWYNENHLRELEVAVEEDTHGDSLIAKKLHEFCETEYRPYLQSLTTSLLQTLLERAYWSRLWVIQEYVLSNSAIVACGSRRYDAVTLEAGFTALSHFLNNSTRRGAFAPATGLTTDHFTKQTKVMTSLCRVHDFLSREDKASDRKTLLELLNQVTGTDLFLGYGVAARCFCSDPRDFVYALHALALDSREQLKPDYGKSWQEVFTEMARDLAFAGEFGLMFAGLQDLSSPLPSWAPNWGVAWENALWRPTLLCTPLDEISNHDHHSVDAASGFVRRQSIPVSVSLQTHPQDGTLSLPHATIGVIDRILGHETTIGTITPWDDNALVTIHNVIVHHPYVLKTWFRDLAIFTATFSHADEGTPSRILL